MKKHGPKRILETKFLYCNKHGDCDHVESGIKIKKWKCCACTVEYSYAYMKRQKIKAVDYLGGECEICKYNKCLSSMVFHHKNPLLKNFNLNGTGLCKSWDKVQKELDKCMLLCANCHFEIHDQEDKIVMLDKKKKETKYHKKLIHQINSKKLGKKPSL